MTLLLFKFGLPTVLGYALFAGISGQFNPLRRPPSLKHRPAWILGLWTWLTVTLVLTIGIQMAYQIPVNAVEALLKPSASLLATLLIPGLLIYFVYGHLVHKELNNTETSRFDWLLAAEEVDSDHLADERVTVVPAYLRSVDTGTIGLEDLPEAVNDANRLVVPDQSKVAPGVDSQHMAPADENLSLRARLNMEKALRKETEQQLTSTRKALSSREQEIKQLLGRRNSVNTRLLNLQQDLVSARRELRRSNAARAKALSTANKTIAFARQAVQVRANLEQQLFRSREALQSTQSAISGGTLGRADNDTQRSIKGAGAHGQTSSGRVTQDDGKPQTDKTFDEHMHTEGQGRTVPQSQGLNHGKAS